MFPGLGLYTTHADPAQHPTTACEELDDLSDLSVDDLSDEVCIVYHYTRVPWTINLKLDSVG